MAGIPSGAAGGGGAPSLPKTLKEKSAGRRLIVVLEGASLETVKTKKGYELLNCDDHLAYHKKLGREPADSRPDICHQVLLTLLDSPLNKAGLLQIFVHTQQRVLIEVSPHLRIPRTFKRFAGLMVQLLHKMKIRASGSSETLLKVIKNPVTAHLPPGAHVFAMEVGGEQTTPSDLVPTLPTDVPVVFVVGAMAQGNISPDYATRTVSLSRYALSADTAVSRLLAALESHWGVL